MQTLKVLDFTIKENEEIKITKLKTILNGLTTKNGISDKHVEQLKVAYMEFSPYRNMIIELL